MKGRKYIGSPFKYYFTDVGLRNARLNFRQQEEKHIMENVIFNELLVRNFSVDVGTVNNLYGHKIEELPPGLLFYIKSRILYLAFRQSRIVWTSFLAVEIMMELLQAFFATAPFWLL